MITKIRKYKKTKKRITTLRKYNKNSKSKTFKNLNCSPNLNKNEINNFSCYTNSNILILKNLWNKKNKNNKITEKNPLKIWIQLKKNMEDLCNKESCWLKQDFIKENVLLIENLKNSFLPSIPESWKKNPNEWLSNIDINNVLKHYENAYKNFEFIGPTPIDFNYKYNQKNCVCNKMCNFNLNEKIQKNINKIGIIFNLDPHYKGGSHWVSLFIDIFEKEIFYFDSAGNKIPNEILNFVNTVIKQGKILNPPIFLNFNQNYPNAHQYKNTECGVYSLFFIIKMLENKKDGNFFKTKKIKDNEIQKYRNIFFNNDL